LGVDLVPAMRGERVAQEALMVREHDWVPVAQLLHELSRAFDVRKEKSDRSTRQVRHGTDKREPFPREPQASAASVRY
jgi:hypothetical protein